MPSASIFLQTVLVLCSSSSIFAAPANFPRVTVPMEHFEVLSLRANTEINPSAVIDVKCLDTKANIVFHDQNTAELAICGGIAGSITKCGGSPKMTHGQYASAQFSLTPTVKGAIINISKNRWEQCVRAARGVCPTGSFMATCIGGASSGDIAFTLGNPVNVSDDL